MTNGLISTYLLCLGVIFALITAAFAASRILGKRNDAADIMRGFGFIVIAWLSYTANIGPGESNRLGLVVSTLVTVWGLRLIWHTGSRFLRTTDRDTHYYQLQQKWGMHELRNSYFRIFLPQGVLLLIASAPVIIANVFGGTPPLLAVLGATLWLVGFGWEVVAERQLRRFLAQQHHESQVLTSGLWRFSRHPNYFGKVVLWWGIAVMTLMLPYGWLGLVGPLAITILITKASGIPLLEARHKGDKAWEAYAARTNSFIPWLPKK